MRKTGEILRQDETGKVFTYSECRECGRDFQPVTWNRFRVGGFCSEICADRYLDEAWEVRREASA